jgi:hypothetical protein
VTEDAIRSDFLDFDKPPCRQVEERGGHGVAADLPVASQEVDERGRFVAAEVEGGRGGLDLFRRGGRRRQDEANQPDRQGDEAGDEQERSVHRKAL